MLRIVQNIDALLKEVKDLRDDGTSLTQSLNAKMGRSILAGTPFSNAVSASKGLSGLMVPAEPLRAKSDAPEKKTHKTKSAVKEFKAEKKESPSQTLLDCHRTAVRGIEEQLGRAIVFAKMVELDSLRDLAALEKECTAKDKSDIPLASLSASKNDVYKCFLAAFAIANRLRQQLVCAQLQYIAASYSEHGDKGKHSNSLLQIETNLSATLLPFIGCVAPTQKADDQKNLDTAMRTALSQHKSASLTQCGTKATALRRLWCGDLSVVGGLEVKVIKPEDPLFQTTLEQLEVTSPVARALNTASQLLHIEDGKLESAFQRTFSGTAELRELEASASPIGETPKRKSSDKSDADAVAKAKYELQSQMYAATGPGAEKKSAKPPEKAGDSYKGKERATTFHHERESEPSTSRSAVSANQKAEAVSGIFAILRLLG